MTAESSYPSQEFQTEYDLVECMVQALSGPRWGCVSISLEFAYQSGRTDIIARSNEGRVLAFEAKLRRWRDALHQAYCNTSFSHQSYVVVPGPIARKAAEYRVEFESRAVGLCGFENGQIEIVIPACVQEPILPCLSRKAEKVLDSSDAVTASAT